MSKSWRSSSASASCRLECGPSPGLCLALKGLGVLAALAVWGSDLAWPWASLLSAAALAQGWRLAQREARMAPCSLVLSSDGGASLHQIPMASVALAWRGPLAVVSMRDAHGRARRLPLWPDRLPAAARRELRLAAPLASIAPRGGSMAP